MRHSLKNYAQISLLALLIFAPSSFLAAQTTQPSVVARETVGEKVPSEDSIIPDFHSLGLINGKFNIFRCASPIRDLAKKPGASIDNPETMSQAATRMKHLHDLGIRTIISFVGPDKEDQSGKTADTPTARSPYAIEKAAADAAGIDFISHPMSNSGPNSLQVMTTSEVLAWITQVETDIFRASEHGAVVYHCSAGHDRTGIVSAYLRIKYNHWTAQQAIEELRRYGHNWPKYSANGGVSSWHETHILEIARLLQTPATEQAKP